ncbi:MAG: glycoside hydrolase family 28 protein, partial [Duncaniella sp.]|nr:glycoside hydrolase family 28 protein [Duncaniella sp.]
VVPAGKWLTGRLTLRSNIRLQIDKDAELHFSGEIADYLPVVPCRNEGIDIYSLGALIYADGVENIALTGEGKLVGPDYDSELGTRHEGGISEEVGKMPVERRVYDGSNNALVFLPVFFGPMNCRNILVEGVTFEHSIFWNIVPTYCENIIIRGVTVSSHGRSRTDGIDIDSSRNALIEYTTLDCGDDCFTLKSGRGIDGVKRARPTENVVIRNCRVKRGVGGITMGTETAAGIRNVYMHDCVMENPSFPFYIKTRRPRGGGAENITVERVTVDTSRKTAFKFDMLGSPEWIGELAERYPARPVGELTPRFSNMTFRDITINSCPALINAKGIPEQPIEGLVFENIKAPTMEMNLQDVGTLIFK